MIDLLPPDFHGSDSEKLLQLTQYTRLLYDALSRKMENLGVQDLNPSLARIIMIFQNYFDQFNLNNTETLNLNNNSLLMQFINQNFASINKQTNINNMYAFGADGNCCEKHEGSQGNCNVTAINQGELLIYTGHIIATGTSFTVDYKYPFEYLPAVYVTNADVTASSTEDDISFSASAAATFDFFAIGFIADGVEFEPYEV